MSAPLTIWQPHAFEGLELTAFKGHNREVPPSLLTGYNFGVRLQGVRETTYQRKRFRSGPGTFLAYAPGVALTAKPVSEGAWQHLDMTLTPALLATLLGTDPAELEQASLRGTVESRRNGELYARFAGSHASFRYGAPKLERETKLLGWLNLLLGNATTETSRDGHEHRAVALVRDYLLEHATSEVSLDELADLTDLSRHYLLRVFKSETGLSPHQYQAGLRLARARTLLARGVPPAQVALEVGVYDQSGLNRLFKRYLFVTPGQYKKGLRHP